MQAVVVVSYRRLAHGPPRHLAGTSPPYRFARDVPEELSDMVGGNLGGVGGQVELVAVPEEAFQMILVVLDSLGGLTFTAAVEDITLNEGFQTGNHMEVIQVVVAHLFHAVLARFSLKSRGGRI